MLYFSLKCNYFSNFSSFIGKGDFIGLCSIYVTACHDGRLSGSAVTILRKKHKVVQINPVVSMEMICGKTDTYLRRLTQRDLEIQAVPVCTLNADTSLKALHYNLFKNTALTLEYMAKSDHFPHLYTPPY